MDYKPRHYDRPTPLFEARKNLFSHCSGSPITLQKEPGEDYRHPALGNFTCPPCSLPTDFLVSRPLLQPPTIASTQQNGNHSSTFLMTLLPLLSTTTFISLLALVSLNSNILRFHPNPNFPVTSLSNVMFGSGSEIQTVKRDDCPIHRKRLYFGQKSLFFHFSNPYL